MGRMRPYLVSVRMFLAGIALVLIIGKFLNPDANPIFLLTAEATAAVENKLPYSTNPLFARAILVLFGLVSAYILIGTAVSWYKEKKEFGFALPLAHPLMLVALFVVTFGCFYYALVAMVVGLYWLFALTLGGIGAVLFLYEYSQWNRER